MVFQFVAFLFAISVHESAHAWMANRQGDPTARMLGRITLNPIKHIDPVGTVLMPLIAMVTGFAVIGWAKPTPVDPRNFKSPVFDDILTSVAGPVSNFMVATAATVLLALIALVIPGGRLIMHGAMSGVAIGDSVLVPASLLLFQFVIINVVLAVFNLIPVPPLDGSHVLRHFLSESVRKAYDTVGIFGLMILVFWGGGLLSRLISPFVAVFTYFLLRA